MSEHKHNLPARFVYNGEVIRDRNEMLSLTDMWKAAGADPSRQPSEWLRSADAQRFISFVTDTLNLGISQNDVIRVVRGGRQPGTWAHWQIALAYAKYLSPEFHMWCNQVVRERMEGRSVPAPGIIRELDSEVRKIIGGILKSVIHHELCEVVPALVRAELAAQHIAIRRGKTAGQIWKACGLPSIKNGARWLGNRLTEMGCRIESGGCGELGEVRARLFDPDKAEVCLRNGLLHKTKLYVAERLGQGSLRLVPGGAA